MKILLNPKDGAPISNIWISGVFYLDAKKGETFQPGTILQFEDEASEYLQSLYLFLEEVTPEQAKIYLANRKKPFACEFCDFKADVKIALIGHMRTHPEQKKEETIDGIPMVKGENRKVIPVERNSMEIIERDAAQAGLTGEGLVEERIGGQAFMS